MVTFMYERYCQLRDEQGLRDADVARITGITPSTFSDWKRGKSAPNVQKIAALAKALDTTTDYLITGEVPPIRRGDERQRRPEAYYLNNEEKNLLYLWHELTADQKENVNALMNSFITQKRENPVSLYLPEQEERNA